MQIVPLYRYMRTDGGVTVSPSKPDGEYTSMYRIIAGDGMLVTLDGIDTYPCIDTNVADGWYEIIDTTQTGGELSTEQALDIITGGTP